MKRLVSFFLAAIIITSALPLSVISANASPFSGGDGSEANPYLVATPEALNAIRNNPSAHYRQIADIDMSAWGNWEGTNLYGSYNGNGFTIRNLKITHNDKNRKSTWFGLFESVFHATVKNVNLVNIDYSINTIVGNYAFYGMAIGGIAAWADSANIENCSVSGKINIQEGYFYEIGGILGHSHGKVTVKNCTNAASIKTVTGHTEKDCETILACGGIAGQIDGDDVIEHCTNIGSLNITSNNNAYVGGIIGNALYSAFITDCLNSGNILVNLPVNGLDEPPRYPFECITGGILGKGKSTISTCINYGSIDAVTYNSEVSVVICGGISGCDSIYSNDSTITNCINAGAHLNIASKGAGELHKLSKVSRISPVASTIVNCYSYDKTMVNGIICQDTGLTRPNGNNITKGDLLLTSSYPGFDFSNTWMIDTKVGGAILREVPFTIEPTEPLPITPTEPEVDYIPFDELAYRTEYLTSHLLSDKAYSDLLLTYKGSPSKAIVEASGDMLFYSANAWRNITEAMALVTEGDLDIITRNLEEKDLIMVYILQALDMQKDVLALDTLKTSSKDLIEIVEKSNDLINALNATGEDFRTFAGKHTSEISDIFIDYYESQNSPLLAWAKSAAMMDVLETFIKGAQDWWDLYAKIDSFAKVYVANDATKKALRLMYENCPDEAESTKWALAAIVEVMSAASDEALQDILNQEFANSCMKQGLDYWADQTWEILNDKICVEYPTVYLALKMYDYGLYFIDRITKADSTVEQYFKLCVMKDLDYLAGDAVSDALDNYRSDSTSFNAEVLLAAIELKFAIIDLDFKESITYCETISDRNIIDDIRSYFGINTGENLKNQLVSLKKSIDTMHYSVEVQWINQLKKESPELAERYEDYLSNVKERFPNRNYTIHCPVNVSVYDASGKLVAEVGEEKVWASGEIAVVYDHGKKEIYFFDNAEYNLICEGYDEGDMDIGITEFDSEGNIVRKVNYNNIPVAPSSVHAISGTELKTNDGVSLPVEYDSARASEKHKVSIENGVISGYLPETEASAGERIEISAIIPEGYRFVGWQGDAEFEDASSASTYFFMKDGEVSVSAKFKKLDRDEDEDDDKPSEGIPVIIIFVIAGGALITLSGIAILIVMIKERKKNSKKEQGNEADSL